MLLQFSSPHLEFLLCSSVQRLHLQVKLHEITCTLSHWGSSLTILPTLLCTFNISQTGTWRRTALRPRSNEVRLVWFCPSHWPTWPHPTSPLLASELWPPPWCHRLTPPCCLQLPSSPPTSTRMSWGPRWGAKTYVWLCLWGFSVIHWGHGISMTRHLGVVTKCYPPHS